MKTVFSIFLLSSLCMLAACNNNSADRTAKTEAAKSKFPRGEALFMQSDCKSCHDINNKIIGPSLGGIAAKYAYSDANVSHLAEVVITGVKMGQGVWGKAEMPPHPKLNKTDAGEIVKYILSLPPNPDEEVLPK